MLSKKKQKTKVETARWELLTNEIDLCWNAKKCVLSDLQKQDVSKTVSCSASKLWELQTKQIQVFYRLKSA